MSPFPCAISQIWCVAAPMDHVGRNPFPRSCLGQVEVAVGSVLFEGHKPGAEQLGVIATLSPAESLISFVGGLGVVRPRLVFGETLCSFVSLSLAPEQASKGQ